jgi:hypothetical protein
LAQRIVPQRRKLQKHSLCHCVCHSQSETNLWAPNLSGVIDL